MIFTTDKLIKILKNRIVNYELKKFHAAPQIADQIDIRVDELKAIIALVKTNYDE